MPRQWYDVIEKDIGSRAEARAAEALYAARMIAKDPQTARGGPWVKPTLTAKMMKEVHQAAVVRTWLSLEAVAAATPGGLLFKHLRDLDFTADTGASRGARVVVKKRRSGTPGHLRTPSSKKQCPKYVGGSKIIGNQI